MIVIIFISHSHLKGSTSDGGGASPAACLSCRPRRWVTQLMRCSSSSSRHSLSRMSAAGHAKGGIVDLGTWEPRFFGLLPHPHPSSKRTSLGQATAADTTYAEKKRKRNVLPAFIGAASPHSPGKCHQHVRAGSGHLLWRQQKVVRFEREGMGST